MQGSILDGLHLVFTRFLFLVGEFHNQDTVLGYQTNQHDDTDLAEDVHGDAAEVHEHQGTGDGQRYGEHDDERVFEALELGGKNQVNQYQSQDEGEHQAGGAFPVVFRITRQGGTESIVQSLGRYLVHFFQSLADGLSFGQSGRDGGRDEPVIVVEFRRSDGFHEVYQVVQLDHFSVVAPDIDGLDVRRLVPLLAVELAQNLVLLAVHVEISHTLAAQSVLQDRGDVFYGDAHGSGLVAVDVHTHFRATELQVHVRHLEGRVVIYRIQEFGQHFFQLFDADRLEHVLDRHATPPASERRLLLDEGTGFRLGLDSLRNLFGYFHLGIVTVFDVLQGDTDVSATARYTGGDRLGVGNNGIYQQVDVFCIVAQVFVAHSFGSFRIDVDLRTVFQRSHFGRNLVPEITDEHQGEEGERNGNDPSFQETFQGLGVDAVQAFEERFRLPVEPALFFPLQQQFGG